MTVETGYVLPNSSISIGDGLKPAPIALNLIAKDPHWFSVFEKSVAYDSIRLEGFGSEEFDALRSSTTHIPAQSLTLANILFDKKTVRSLIKLVSQKLKHLNVFALWDCGWKYSNELVPMLNGKFSHGVDGDASLSLSSFIAQKAQWDQHDCKHELSTFSMLHLEMYTCMQILTTEIFRAAPRLHEFQARKMGLSCLHRPLQDFECQSFVSILFSRSSSLKCIDLSFGGLYDAFFENIRPLWGELGLSTLELLALPGNNVSDRGLLFLLTVDKQCEEVGRNECSKKIDLSHNQIQLKCDKTVKILLECLECNPALTVVLAGNAIAQAGFTHARLSFDGAALEAYTEFTNSTGPTSWTDLLNQSEDEVDDDSEFEASDSAVADDDSSEDVSLASEGSDLLKMLDD